MQLAMERLLEATSLHEIQEEREKPLLVPQRVCEQRIGHGRAHLSLLLCERLTSVAQRLGKHHQATQRQMLNQCGASLCKNTIGPPNTSLRTKTNLFSLIPRFGAKHSANNFAENKILKHFFLLLRRVGAQHSAKNFAENKKHLLKTSSLSYHVLVPKHFAKNFAENNNIFQTSGTTLTRRRFVHSTRNVVPPPFNASRSCEDHRGKKKRTVNMIAHARTLAWHVEIMLGENETATVEEVRISVFFGDAP